MSAPVWLGDRLVAAEDAWIDPTDRGFTLGDGCFDTALTIDGRVFRADQHLDRLAATCAALSLPVARETLEAAQSALAGEIVHGSIRLTVTRGTGARGLALPADPKPTLFGSASPLAPQLMFKPMTLVLAETRRNETSPTARLKTLSYLDAILETNRAKQAGADEPLFLNTKNEIACSALANVFLMAEHDIVTPPLTSGTLDGVMRRFLIETIEEVESAVRVEPIVWDAARTGRFLLTNSLRLISPARVSGSPPLSAEQNEFVRSLMDRTCLTIREACGTDPRELGAEIPDLSA
ncbi:aminotransferase class IV [Fulvimarina sp. MAC8]|uniref:aminotransferase class IV n=1 Tax=Fulvimarina sp. MAC8 TaxID=3162874 RepID=UPI0032EADC2D